MIIAPPMALHTPLSIGGDKLDPNRRPRHPVRWITVPQTIPYNPQRTPSGVRTSTTSDSAQTQQGHGLKPSSTQSPPRRVMLVNGYDDNEIGCDVNQVNAELLECNCPISSDGVTCSTCISHMPLSCHNELLITNGQLDSFWKEQQANAIYLHTIDGDHEQSPTRLCPIRPSADSLIFQPINAKVTSMSSSSPRKQRILSISTSVPRFTPTLLTPVHSLRIKSTFNHLDVCNHPREFAVTTCIDSGADFNCLPEWVINKLSLPVKPLHADS
eukprot:gene12529-26394_t